ncbi:MAG: acyl carrier protein [Parasporobacterium sp.]|nr:acyl carrier protein [Parasporobacterium sp.]
MEELLKLLNDFNGTIDYEKETALVTGGLLDSMDIVSLIGELEDAFEIEISMEDVKEENFDSAQAMWDMICSLK